MDMKKVYNKLVRDKIPDICRANGAIPKTKVIHDPDEYLELLHAKLAEEAAELRETPNLEELADVLEVLYAIATQIDATPQQIENSRMRKAAERGGFADRIFLVETEE